MFSSTSDSAALPPVQSPDLQLANDGVDGGEVVKAESAQIVSIEIVPYHVDVIARPERFLKVAIPGRIQCYDPVVRLASYRLYVMVRRRKGKARRQNARAPRGEVGAIANIRIGLSRVRYPQRAHRGQVRVCAGRDAQ
jgi:hypothetical protein